MGIVTIKHNKFDAKFQARNLGISNSETVSQSDQGLNVEARSG